MGRKEKASYVTALRPRYLRSESRGKDALSTRKMVLDEMSATLGCHRKPRYATDTATEAAEEAWQKSASYRWPVARDGVGFGDFGAYGGRPGSCSPFTKL